LSEATRERLAALLPREASLANQVDMHGSATGATYEAALAPLLADTGLDAVITLFVPPVHAGTDEVAAAIKRAVERARPDKPVLAVIVAEGGAPASLLEPPRPLATFSFPEAAARALGR